MALLGSDFNGTRPTDGEYCQATTGMTGAGLLRDVKTRIAGFFGALFDLNTGNFKPNSVRSEALKSLAPSPAGTWAQVNVNSKGQVTGGEATAVTPHARPFRAYFLPDGTAFYETVDGTTSLTPVAGVESTPSDKVPLLGGPIISEFYEFAFPVPAGVSAVRAYLVAGGQAGESGVAGNAGAVCWVDFPVYADYTVSVIVGLGGILSGRVGGHSQIRQTSAVDRYVNTQTNTGAAGGWESADIGFPFRSSVDSPSPEWLEDPHRVLAPMWYPYGLGGAVDGNGQGGLVILEWYA